MEIPWITMTTTTVQDHTKELLYPELSYMRLLLHTLYLRATVQKLFEVELLK